MVEENCRLFELMTDLFFSFYDDLFAVPFDDVFLSSHEQPNPESNILVMTGKS